MQYYRVTNPFRTRNGQIGRMISYEYISTKLKYKSSLVLQFSDMYNEVYSLLEVELLKEDNPFIPKELKVDNMQLIE